jgi:hypothetical protein
MTFASGDPLYVGKLAANENSISGTMSSSTYGNGTFTMNRVN